jgi:hypothetical protein
MKKLLLMAAAAVAGLVVVRRARGNRAEADLWHEATREIDLR